MFSRILAYVTGGERVECQHAAKRCGSSLARRIGWEIYAREKDGSERDQVGEDRSEVGLDSASC